MSRDGRRHLRNIKFNNTVPELGLGDDGFMNLQLNDSRVLAYEAELSTRHPMVISFSRFYQAFDHFSNYYYCYYYCK